jgi:hypothetical protein
LRKSLVIVTTAVVVLVAAASAFAAINSYTAKVAVSPTKAGTKSKPVAIGYTEDLTATGTAGNRTALLQDIKTTLSGAKVTLKGVPTCSLKSIAAAKNDTGCPKGALLATGYIHAVVGSATDFTAAAAPCNPGLDVWNSGGGKLTFFFVDTAAHNCDALGLKTGSTGPYPATYKQSGSKVVVDTPIPSFVNRPLGLAGSLEVEHLKWANLKTKVNGKKVGVLQSTGCQGGKRAYAVSFTANLPTTNTTETKVVSGKAPCKS